MAKKTKFDLSVIVPVFNEEGNVKALFQEIVRSVEQLKLKSEIIFVDDGSTDNTARELANLHPLTVIQLRINCGQSTALETGIQKCRGRIVITLDADLQNDPKDFSKLLDKLNEGYDAVCGWRSDRHDSTSKKIVSSGARILRNMLIDDGVHDAGCSLRAYYRSCIQEIYLYGELHRMIPALLKLKGFNVGEVKVNHRPRIKGSSKYGLKRITNGLLDIFHVWINQKYGKRPLYLFGSVGIFILTISFVLLVILMIMRLFFAYHLSNKIWPLVGVFGFISGMQLLIFGVLADLILRNNTHLLDAPIRSIKTYV